MTAATASPIEESIEEQGLRYVTDASPGYTRVRRGKGFSWRDTRGEPIRDERRLARIKALAVPPAWTDVWVCPSPNGHIQATGIDARGRKQYRYHDRWREVRDEAKYHQVLRFAAALPAMRKRIEADMRREGLPREKVLATVVRLLDVTLIRVGNAEYARNNQSYGLTTLRRKHVEVNGSEVRFRFTGKSGKVWDLAVSDRRIANVVRRCSDLPGYEIFKYEDDDGNLVDVTSGDVNAYLREISGEDFTAKDFRTWTGTVLAAMALGAFEEVDSDAQARQNVVRAIERVARELGNTPAICRKCYVHPRILEGYLDNRLADMIDDEIDEKMRKEFSHLSHDERLVLVFLDNELGSDRSRK